MTRLSVRKQAHRTTTKKHVDKQDAPDIQKKNLLIFGI